MMRYLIAIDRERGEGILSTETGIILRYIKESGEDVLSLLKTLTDKIPFSKKQAAIHISYGDSADVTDCDSLEREIEVWADERTAVLCEDRMVHRLYSSFEEDEQGIALYVYPDAGAGRLHAGGIVVVGGVGAPVFSEGSAFTLGINTVRAALSAAEKSGPPSMLVTLLEEAFGLPIQDVRNELAALSPIKLAHYARLAAKGKEMGDAVSTALWNDMLRGLSSYVYTLSRGEEKLGIKVTEGPKTFSSLLIADLSAYLGDRFSVSESKAPILLGGIKRAAEMLGIPADDRFCRTFLETYKNIGK